MKLHRQAHLVYKTQYHIVWVTRYRRKILNEGIAKYFKKALKEVRDPDWFIEEIGELATALSSENFENKQEEFADVIAWLCTLANINNVDLEKACEKYTNGDVKGFK